MLGSEAEVADADKPPVVQAYLDRWGWEVGQFFEGLDRHATVDAVLTVAPDFPGVCRRPASFVTLRRLVPATAQ